MVRQLRALAVLVLFSCGLLVSAQQTIRVPQDQATIQAAIDAAADGDTVLVSPGVYTVSLDLKGKALTLTTGATSYTQPVVAQTILQAQGVPVAVFYRGEGRGTVINGFTITDPSQPFLPILGPGGATGKILSAVLDDVAGANSTTGLQPANASPTITNNRFFNAVSAISLAGPEIAGNDFVDCSGNFIITNGFSPYVSAQGPPPSIHGNVFKDNSAVEGVASFGSILNNQFLNNTFTTDLLFVDRSTDANFSGLTIIAGNLFSGNMGAHSPSVPSTLMAIADRALVYNNLAYGNHFDTLLTLSADQDSINTVVAENTFASNGPALDCPGACPATQILFKEKDAYSGNGVVVANNVFQTSAPGPFLACQDDPGSLQQDTFQVDHNLFSPTASLYDSTCRPQIVNAGNLFGDPAFANPGANDFHLTAGSPAVDSGNNSLIQQIALLGGSLSTDLDSAPRPVDATHKGYPIIDMGAYELPGLADGQPTSLLLTPSTYLPNVTQPITFTAALSSSLGVPVGPVTFFEDGQQVASQLVDNTGTTSLILPFNSTGAVEFIATYPGAYPFAPATSTKLVLEILKFSTYITLVATPTTATLGGPVTLQMMTGSNDPTSVPSPITLTVNGAFLATLLPDAKGNASLTTTSLPAGIDTIVATYAGDARHSASSATATVTIVVNDFTISLGPPVLTLPSGQQSQSTVLLSSLGVFADGVQLKVANVPQYGAASLSPANVALSPGGTASAVLTIRTSTLPAHATLRLERHGGAILPVLALLSLLPVPLLVRARRRGVRVILCILGLCFFSNLLGCTNISYPLNDVAPGTYILPITATDPATGIIHSANLTLIVTAS